MGKKSRVKIQKSGSGATATVSPKEMMNLINELLQSMFSPYFEMNETRGVILLFGSLLTHGAM